MKTLKRLDAQSLLVGTVLGAVTLLCLGAGLKHGNQVGRFMLGVGDSNTVYVIDTVSGQVWEKGATNRQEFFAPKATESKF